MKTSVLLEINRTCNTILPAEDGIEPPPRTFVRVQRAVEYFQESGASRIEVVAYRGSSRLSTGTVMGERAGIAADRATKVRDILTGLGVPAGPVNVTLVTDLKDPDGVNDP